MNAQVTSRLNRATKLSVALASICAFVLTACASSRSAVSKPHSPGAAAVAYVDAMRTGNDAVLESLACPLVPDGAPVMVGTPPGKHLVSSVARVRKVGRYWQVTVTSGSPDNPSTTQHTVNVYRKAHGYAVCEAEYGLR